MTIEESRLAPGVKVPDPWGDEQQTPHWFYLDDDFADFYPIDIRAGTV